jgi:hypothetical protein
MKKTALNYIANACTTEDISPLTRVKMALANFFEEEAGHNIKDILAPKAFKSDELTFEKFVDLIGFTKFHDLCEGEGALPEDFDSFEEFEAFMNEKSKEAQQFATKHVNEFTESLLNDIAALLTCMGHQTTMMVINPETQGEILKQLNELKKEADE